jgi:hypothetical protein
MHLRLSLFGIPTIYGHQHILTCVVGRNQWQSIKGGLIVVKTVSQQTTHQWVSFYTSLPSNMPTIGIFCGKNLFLCLILPPERAPCAKCVNRCKQLMESPLDQSPEPPVAPKSVFNRVLLINLGIMLAYVVLTAFMQDMYLILTAFLIVVHTLICLISGLIFLIPSIRRVPLAQGLLLSALLVLLIGFGACIAKAAILEPFKT